MRRNPLNELIASANEQVDDYGGGAMAIHSFSDNNAQFIVFQIIMLNW